MGTSRARMVRAPRSRGEGATPRRGPRTGCRRAAIAAVVAVLWAALAGPATAEDGRTYRGLEGYTVSLPAGWHAAAAEDIERIEGPEDLTGNRSAAIFSPRLFAGTDAPVPHVTLSFVRLGSSVLDSKGWFAIDQPWAADAMAKALQETVLAGREGLELRDPDWDLERRCWTFTYDATLGRPLRGAVVAYLRREQVVLLTAVATPQTWERVRSAAVGLMESFRFSPPHRPRGDDDLRGVTSVALEVFTERGSLDASIRDVVRSVLARYGIPFEEDPRDPTTPRLRVAIRSHPRTGLGAYVAGVRVELIRRARPVGAPDERVSASTWSSHALVRTEDGAEVLGLVDEMLSAFALRWAASHESPDRLAGLHLATPARHTSPSDRAWAFIPAELRRRVEAMPGDHQETVRRFFAQNLPLLEDESTRPAVVLALRGVLDQLAAEGR